jgi:hypothetical protein
MVVAVPEDVTAAGKDPDEVLRRRVAVDELDPSDGAIILLL